MYTVYQEENYPNSEKFKFGDNEKLCADLTELVRLGKKTATCGAFRDFEDGLEAMPEVGRVDIVLNWDGTPALAIRTKSVEVKKFCDVKDDFALLEGEDETLVEWQEGHKKFFERNGGFDPEMYLVCERFELVEVFENDIK